jgi:hypothetical protein
MLTCAEAETAKSALVRITVVTITCERPGDAIR